MLLPLIVLDNYCGNLCLIVYAFNFQPTPGFKPLVTTAPASFSEVDSGHGNFADFSRFETIPSQEALNVNDDTIQARGTGMATSSIEKHRRSESLDYKQFVSFTLCTFVGRIVLIIIHL